MAYQQNRGQVFVFTTGGAPKQSKAQNQYTSWTDLIADISQSTITGKKTILFDRLGGTPTIPAGAYDLKNITLSGGTNTTFPGFSLDPEFLTGGENGQTQVDLAPGVTFTNLTHITDGLLLVAQQITGSIVSLSGTGSSRFLIDNGSAIRVGVGQIPDGGGGGPGFFSVADTHTLNIYLHNGGLLAGSDSPLIVNVLVVGATCNIFASGQSRIEASVLTDRGVGVVVATDIDGAPTIFTDQSGSTGDPGLQGGLLTVTNNVDADSIAYDPATSGLTGENVQDAIDDLAARGVAEGVTTVSITSALGVDDGPLIDVTAGSITITLPAAASAAVGKTYHIKDTDGLAAATNITIDGDGAETIDGETTFILSSNFQGITVVNLGDKWTVI